MKVIDKKLVNELVSMLIKHKQIKGKARYGLTFDSKYSYDKHINNFSAKLDDWDESNMDAIITVPYYFSKHNFNDTSFYYRYIIYIKKTFNIDLEKIGNENDLELEDLFIVTCVLHEISHIICFIKEYYEYDYLAEHYSCKKDYDECRMLMKDGVDIFDKYRNIKSEFKADSNACKLFMKYFNEIKDILNKGYITDECELAKAE